MVVRGCGKSMRIPIRGLYPAHLLSFRLSSWTRDRPCHTQVELARAFTRVYHAAMPHVQTPVKPAAGAAQSQKGASARPQPCPSRWSVGSHCAHGRMQEGRGDQSAFFAAPSSFAIEKLRSSLSSPRDTAQSIEPPMHIGTK